MHDHARFVAKARAARWLRAFGMSEEDAAKRVGLKLNPEPPGGWAAMDEKVRELLTHGARQAQAMSESPRRIETIELPLW